MEQKDPILMVAATPFFSDRGGHIRIYNEIKALQKEGVEVVLCTYHLGNEVPGVVTKRTKEVSWYTKVTPGASWGKLYLDLLLLGVTYKEFKKMRPKIIHAHLYEGLLIAWLVKVFSFSKTRIVFDCQGSLAEEMYAYTLYKHALFKLAYPAFVALEWLLLHLPNSVVCSSENSLSVLTRRYPFTKKYIDILPDRADPDLFHTTTEQEKKEARAKLGIPAGNMVIIYTGSLTHAKGVGELLEAVPSIIEKRPDITFVFAGYGDLLETYQNKLKTLIDSKNVVFTGRFSYFDLPKLLAVADYAIDPKKNSSESSGKMYNYIAAGLQVICFPSTLTEQIKKDLILIESLADIKKLSKK